MRHFLFLIAAALLLPACSEEHAKAFHVSQPTNPDLDQKAKTFVPRLIKACPGLDRYSQDFTAATVSASQMDGYAGGIMLQFAVAQQPQEIPAPLRSRSAGNTCYIDIAKDGSRAYIGKSACHSLCEGIGQENSLGLMGREYSLR